VTGSRRGHLVSNLTPPTQTSAHHAPALKLQARSRRPAVHVANTCRSNRLLAGSKSRPADEPRTKDQEA
jgi:hypothetical protein